MSHVDHQSIPSFVYKIFLASKQAMVVVSKTGEIVVQNKEFSKLINDRLAERIDFTRFLDGSTNQSIWGEEAKVGPWEGVITYKQENGTTIRYWLDAQQMEGIGKEVYFLLSLTKDDKRIEHYEEINFMAYHDVLTKLPNRLLFEERINKLLQTVQASSSIGAMLFIDLNRFKLINDTFGHANGDRLLKEAAQRLKACMGEHDVVARIGGDELACFFPNIDNQQAAVEKVMAILQAFSPAFLLQETEVYVTASIGVSFFPYDGETFETLLIKADTAMYRAKKKGTNNYEIFHSDFQTSSFKRLQLENMLRQAINQEQFTLCYQPQVNVITKQIEVVEALIRWEHPEYGEITPDEFIPIAEETGLIRTIDEWVIRKACQQSIQWQAEGYKPIRMSVNLSAQQFMQRNFPNQLSKVLKESKLAPHLLAVEITETMIMQDTKQSVTQLEKIRGMGVNVVIDNFGIGYSSFQYLKNFPIDCLKIDRTFISDMAKNANSTTIMKAMVNLGRDLGLRVIAEGVETKEQLLYLQEQKCDVVQGRYFYPPLPKQAITPLLNKADF